VNGEENEGRKAQDRGDDRGEIGVQSEACQEPPDKIALERAGDQDADAEKRRESHEPQKRDVVAADVKERPLEQGEVHRFSLGRWASCATGKQKTRPKPRFFFGINKSVRQLITASKICLRCT
jgi:hypothetical protein